MEIIIFLGVMFIWLLMMDWILSLIKENYWDNSEKTASDIIDIIVIILIWIGIWITFHIIIWWIFIMIAFAVKAWK